MQDYAITIKLVASDMETTAQFQDKSFASCLGIVAFFKKGLTTNPHFYLFLAEGASQDALFTNTGLEVLISIAKAKNVKKVQLWSDVGESYLEFEHISYFHFHFHFHLRFNSFILCLFWFYF